MNPNQSYKPTEQAITLLNDLANLGHHISYFGVLATFASSSSDLDDYVTLIGKNAAEVQRRIGEFRQSSEVKP